MFALTDKTYIYKMWFVDLPDSNFMAHVYREGDGPWLGIYRFRHFADDKIGTESEDTRNWYKLEAKDASDESRDSLVEAINVCAQAGVDVFGGELDVLVIDGDVPTYIEKMQQFEWFHISTDPRMESLRGPVQ